MIDIYLIRHGESMANLDHEHVGGRATKSKLSSLGVMQAEKLGRFLEQNRVRFDVTMSSEATRAIQTAKLATRQTPAILNDFEELDQGEWEGKLRSEVYTKEALHDINLRPLHFRSPKGESKLEVAQRAWIALKNDVFTLPDETVVGLFGHGFLFKCLLWYMMDFKADLIYPLTIDNCSISRVMYDSSTNSFHIKCINLSSDALK